MIGVVIGGVLGSVLAVYLAGIMTLLSTLLEGGSVFMYLPSYWQWHDFFLVCGASLTLSFLATLYPAWCATKIKPAEALNY